MISTALSITHLKIRLTLGFKVTSVRIGKTRRKAAHVGRGLTVSK